MGIVRSLCKTGTLIVANLKTYIQMPLLFQWLLVLINESQVYGRAYYKLLAAFSYVWTTQFLYLLSSRKQLCSFCFWFVRSILLFVDFFTLFILLQLVSFLCVGCSLLVVLSLTLCSFFAFPVFCSALLFILCFLFSFCLYQRPLTQLCAALVTNTENFKKTQYVVSSFQQIINNFNC